MDHNTMTVAMTALIASGIVLSLFGFSVGRALADRIRGQAGARGAEELKAVRDELAGEVQQLRTELTELVERVDFAERLLAKQSDAGRLAPPGGR